MTRRVTIDPITRLEGHGRIEIFLDDAGNVEQAYFQVPELRGFEKFCEGRPAEEMPRLTPRICGVCPWAHHFAATKALDDLWQVPPTPAALKVRRLAYNAFYVEDHSIHFYFLASPDFVVGPTAPKAERNIVGVIGKVGVESGKVVIRSRKAARYMTQYLGGRPSHAVCGLPGGITKGIDPKDLPEFKAAARTVLEFADFTLKLFDAVVLQNKAYVDLIVGEGYRGKTYFAGLVDEANKTDFYDGKIRVVDPDGREFAKFDVHDYLDHMAEHVEPWSYMKFLYLKKVGWKGFVDGAASGIYKVGPLGRFNASEGYSTPRAQEAYEKMVEVLGGKPVHFTLAHHWARVIEIMHAAELVNQFVEDPEITSTDLRNMNHKTPAEGIGIVEAPRGLLIHHYTSDPNGMLASANLLVATQHQLAAINMSVDQAAKFLIKDGKVDDGLLNMVEMAFRAYDPCHGCGTHCLPGEVPVEVAIHHTDGQIQILKR